MGRLRTTQGWVNGWQRTRRRARGRGSSSASTSSCSSSLVSGALLTSGLIEIYFSYQEQRGGAGPDPAREGRRRRLSDRAVPGRRRAPGRRRRPDADPLRRRRRWRSAATSTSGSCAGRPRSPKSATSTRTGHEQLRVSRLAMNTVGSNIDFSARPAVPAGHARPDLLRPGLLPQRVRAVHDPRRRRVRPKRRRGHGRREPQVHLGRGVADQDRAARLRLRGRCRRPPGRPPGHQPGAPEDRAVGPRPRSRPRTARGPRTLGDAAGASSRATSRASRS